MSKKLVLLSLATAAWPFATAAQSRVENIQSTLQQWVKVESELSRESNDWQVEKTILADTLAVLAQQRAALTEAIATARETASAAETQRAEFDAQRAGLRTIAELVETRIAALESGVLALLPRLPAPLAAEIAPLVRRIPITDTTRVALSSRVQNVVGILTLVDKFNAGVSLVTEVRDVDGSPKEVRTLYFGLATGYFLDGSGTYSGRGTPGDTGWVWSTDATLAPTVGNLFAIYDSTRPAAYVGLPVEIR